MAVATVRPVATVARRAVIVAEPDTPRLPKARAMRGPF